MTTLITAAKETNGSYFKITFGFRNLRCAIHDSSPNGFTRSILIDLPSFAKNTYTTQGQILFDAGRSSTNPSSLPDCLQPGFEFSRVK